jgi:hypothetical protein
LVEPPISAHWDGQLDVPDGAGFSFIPPSPAGGVGPDHVMEMAQNQTTVQTRSGGAVVTIDTSVFWSPLGATPLSPTNQFHRLNYDTLIGRWIASARNGTNPAAQIFLAVSQTDDPTGTWDYYSWTADGSAVTFPDWVVSGYSGTYVAITADMFNVSGGAFVGPKLWVLDVAGLLTATPTLYTFATGYAAAVSGFGSNREYPSRSLDTSDPALYICNDAFTSGGVFLLQTFQVTGPGAPTLSTIGPSTIGSASSGFAFVPNNFTGTQRTMSQFGDVRNMNPFSVRVASLVVRNGRIWVANSGGLPGPSTNTSPTRTGILWAQSNPAAMPTPFVQGGVIDGGAGTASIIPSLAVNCGDDVLVAFSNGDAGIYARAAYTFRLGSSGPGVMGAITTLKAGEENYWKNFGVGTFAQWGNYSSTTCDPIDDHTLWTVQEYADTRAASPGVDNDSRWGTRWARFGDCVGLASILNEPDDVVACVGDPVTFAVIVSAPDSPTYQWRKDGNDIPLANSNSYSIGSTVGGDLGAYDCVITNGCGTLNSAVANLSFAGAVVTTQPTNQFAPVGGSASFFVAGTGTGTLHYQWFHGVTPIGPDADTLTISPVVVADYGDYHVNVSDDCGPIASDTAKLNADKVSGKHQPAELSFHIFEHPKSQTICNGSPVTFSVAAFPVGVTYVWRKNLTPIVPPETNSSLTILAVSPADVGNYDVVVSFGPNTKTSAPAGLSVIDVPTITTQPAPVSQTLAPGSTISYSMAASGPGTNLSYQWEHRPNVPFAPFVAIPNETGTSLLIENITASDGGTYRCRVSNECGFTRTRNCGVIVLN